MYVLLGVQLAATDAVLEKNVIKQSNINILGRKHT